MKKCKYCNINKSISEFYSYKTKGQERITSDCRACNTTRRVANNMRVKIAAIEYLGGECFSCGYSKNPKALEFHHREPSAKDFGIAKYQKSNIDDLKDELDKCDLLCANCHRERHDEIWRNGNTFTESLYNDILEKSLRDRSKKPDTLCGCGKKISSNAKLCKSCLGKAQEKISWPSDLKLKELVWTKPMSKLSKELGVSDKAIKKRCISKNITCPPRGYWLKK